MHIGIDLDGTKIEGIALDDDGSQLWRRRVLSPRDDGAATPATVRRLVRCLKNDPGRRGSIDVDGRVLRPCIETWLLGPDSGVDM